MGNLKTLAALLAVCSVVSVGVTWSFTSSYYNAKLEAQQQAHEAAKQQAAAVAAQQQRSKEAAVAAAVAAADQQHYKELQDAKTEIQRLRAGVASGTVRLRQPTTATRCAGTDQLASSPRVGNDGRAERTASEPTVEQDILQLGEYALTAVKQRDACVAILQQEREVLNEKR